MDKPNAGSRKGLCVCFGYRKGLTQIRAAQLAATCNLALNLGSGFVTRVESQYNGRFKETKSLSTRETNGWINL